jgi:hypothetical protein
LQSRAQASPREIFRPNPFTAWSLTGNVGASAATANARIRAMMNYGKTGSARKYWNHIDDRSTASMGDDRFEIRDGIW